MLLFISLVVNISFHLFKDVHISAVVRIYLIIYRWLLAYRNPYYLEWFLFLIYLFSSHSRAPFSMRTIKNILTPSKYLWAELGNVCKKEARLKTANLEEDYLAAMACLSNRCQSLKNSFLRCLNLLAVFLHSVTHSYISVSQNIFYRTLAPKTVAQSTVAQIMYTISPPDGHSSM